MSGAPRRSTPRAKTALGIGSEDALFEEIRGLCRLIGLIPPKNIGTRPMSGYGFLYHTKISRGSTAGLPDCYLLNTYGDEMWRELKLDDTFLSPEQEIVIGLQQLGGRDVAVWRPRDWYSGRIAREIQAFARRRPILIARPGETA